MLFVFSVHSHTCHVLHSPLIVIALVKNIESQRDKHKRCCGALHEDRDTLDTYRANLEKTTVSLRRQLLGDWSK